MIPDTQKFLCLLDELETSAKLLKAGFGALQEIDTENDFYHLPHQLMASGLERLMKCYIALVFEDRNGSYPDVPYMQKLGHDLCNLLDKICAEFYGGKTRPLVQREFDFIINDTTLQECIRILSLFGKYGRYYNLDIVAGSPHGPIDPKSEWEALETTIEDITPYLDTKEALYRDYYPRVHAKLISKLERFVRAIAFQFTIGDHVDQFGRLREASVVLSDFRSLRDETLGTNDYRRSVRILQQKKENWIKRTEQEITSSKWPTRIVTREEFDDEWPFRADRVIIECRDNLFCIANIEGYAFALNGAAATHLRIPFPHDAGEAVLGRSVHRVTKMAQALSNL